MREIQGNLYQADRSERLVDYLATLPECFTEWELTALFYSALHYVTAFLTTRGYFPKDHRRRNLLIDELTSVGEEYHNLYRISVNARYDLAEFTTQEVADIKSGDFRRVKEQMLALLAGQA